LEPQIIEEIEPALKRWGVHPSWCRLVASPHLYNQCEEALAELLGVEAFLILPTVTLVSIGVIPALVGKDGVMFLDKFAHMTMYQACKMARDSGATLCSFAHGDLTALEALLDQHRANPKKVILVDGVFSMTGRYPDLGSLSALAKKYDAIVYIDDAHGFGVVGERPDADMPYGYRGNGIVRRAGLRYEADNFMYVAGFSKAYSSMAAGIAGSKNTMSFVKAYATPYDLSGPCPTASLQSLLTSMAVNEARGDDYRRRLYALTKMAVDGLRELGFYVDNDNYFPIVSVWSGDNERLLLAAKILLDAGVLLTLGPYPMIPRGHEELRITLTSANTEEQVERYLLKGFAQVRDAFAAKGYPLKPAP
ncbi:MAG TPA: aminotransferase class I/II-fold pyridoxal phosphate-dependent enzyme, partial [Myxococcota bacterium]|nr:aminotransferase class I/II-fold pyridoxal phosphate-dependent enzyme [Myxococcota bacterium]